MKVNRANIALLTKEMASEGLVFEGATGPAVRGRKPTQIALEEMNRVARIATKCARRNDEGCIFD
jgi:hypothetical protein